MTGSTDEDHQKMLEAAGACLKMLILETSNLCRRTSANGHKSQGLEDVLVSCNVSQLKSFLVLLNYYGKFVSNFSTAQAPLHQLLLRGLPGLGAQNSKPSTRSRVS